MNPGSISGTTGRFGRWRAAARAPLLAKVPPEALEWSDRQGAPTPTAVASGASSASGASGTSGTSGASGAAPRAEARISAALLRLLEALSAYRDPARWEFMYRLAWRCIYESPRLLEDAADRDVRRALLMERAVRRDIHKMHAFVRFRESVNAAGAPIYVAWFEPRHEILELAAPYFVERFRNMAWLIATPDGAATWNDGQLALTAAPDRAQAPPDRFEDLWRTYYRSVCNAARINVSAMRREMPQRYWQHLPEAVEIDRLVRHAAQTLAADSHESQEEETLVTKRMKAALPEPSSDEAPQNCRRCDLWQHATQAVPGEGAAKAAIMLVGEQPGDEEDLRGRPFIGPAGRVLDESLRAAGVDRTTVFVTNAVKHFKWEPRGKRRLHKKPGIGEIDACNVWLEREIATVHPAVIVALGATALRALTGSTLSIEASRRQELSHPSGARLLATYHPSAILRAEGDRSGELREALESDLRTAAASIARLPH